MKKSLVALFTVVVLVLPALLSAQTFHLQDISGGTKPLSVKFTHPLKSGDDPTVFSGVYDFSFTGSLNSNLDYFINVPYVTYRYSKFSKNKGIGNVFLSLVRFIGRSQQAKSAVTLGLHIPTASSNNWYSLFGLMTDLYHYGKYLPDAYTVTMNYSYYRSAGRGLFAFEAGPELFLPKKGQGDNDIFFHYGFSLGVQSPKSLLSLEYTGILDSDNGFDKSNPDHLLSLNVMFKGRKIMPGFFYQVYLNDWISNDISGLFGVKLKFR